MIPLDPGIDIGNDNPCAFRAISIPELIGLGISNAPRKTTARLQARAGSLVDDRWIYLVGFWLGEGCHPWNSSKRLDSGDIGLIHVKEIADDKGGVFQAGGIKELDRLGLTGFGCGDQCIVNILAAFMPIQGVCINTAQVCLLGEMYVYGTTAFALKGLKKAGFDLGIAILRLNGFLRTRVPPGNSHGGSYYEPSNELDQIVDLSHDFLCLNIRSEWDVGLIS